MLLQSAVAKILIVAIVAISMFGVVIGAYVMLKLPPTPTPSPTPSSPPSPFITYTGYKSFNGRELFKVNVTVKNDGGDGWVKVYAEISIAGQNKEQEPQRVFLANGETQSLQFVFEIDPYSISPTLPLGVYPTGIPTPEITYRAWATID